jgi:Na+-transporting NADH:ubiquinone oxidoreductase subunit C
MMASLPGLADLIQSIGAEAIDTLIVDLTTDTLAEGIDPVAFDGTSPTATPLPPEQDLAGLGERPDILRLYALRSDGALQLVILPIMGAGYTSTIQGYLALEGDLVTVAGLTITEQGETPGLGANIATPAWQAKWPGTSLVNDEGELAIDIVQAGASRPWQVDGITGATRTGAGMESMIRFWVGPQGFGPVLEKLQAGTL